MPCIACNDHLKALIEIVGATGKCNGIQGEPKQWRKKKQNTHRTNRQERMNKEKEKRKKNPQRQKKNEELCLS